MPSPAPAPAPAPQDLAALRSSIPSLPPAELAELHDRLNVALSEAADDVNREKETAVFLAQQHLGSKR
ncbi:hypothetical protein TeGR_g3372 [Tetraparma gracilis]|uniref:Uncharacterized protein n=1 Tax=Tetraparma gracilis TaxID=2962635 RepID=A0ABQ6M674_9STRA|nr:hypothetical protein TeGR_g3372 [Tetraparma gracilis]